jgi:UDP-N-acetylmuramoylalanine--D-glutamate ligase
VLTLPDSGPRISAAFAAAAGAGDADEAFADTTDCPDLETAVAEAFAWARRDGVVLLSPAAPSFGRFRDYRDRGDHFAAAMRACAGSAGLAAG